MNWIYKVIIFIKYSSCYVDYFENVKMKVMKFVSVTIFGVGGIAHVF